MSTGTSPLRPGHAALLFGVMIFWGLNFVAAKFGFRDFEPMFLLSIRFLLIGLVLIPFVEMPRGKMVHVLGLSFTLGSLHFGLMFTGIAGVDAAVGAIAIQLQVPFASILAALLFKDYLGWRRMLAMMGAFAGIVLIAGEPRMESSLFHLGLIVVASLVFATSNIQVKAMGDAPPLGVLGWSSLFAAPQLFVLSLIFEENHWHDFQNAGLYGWGAVAYMTVCVGLIGYGIWYSLIRRYAVNQIMPFTLLVPVYGVVGGVWILGEQMTWQMILGAVLTVAGVAVIVLRRPATGEAPLKS